MGAFDLTWDKQKNVFEYVFARGTWQYTLRGDKIEGALWSPDHKQIRIGTLRAIIRQAGLSLEEFFNLLK